MKNSRLSLLTIALVTALGAAACGSDRGQTSNEPAAPAEPQAALEAADEAEPADEAADRGPGFPLLRQVEALDLRADQRAAIESIREGLHADLAPQRASAKKLAAIVADGLDAGRLDRAALDAQRAELEAGAPGAKAAIDRAANALHAALDPAQRAELVLTMRARHEERKARGEDHRGGDGHERRKGRGPLAKLAKELGLSDDQKLALRNALEAGVDELFPHRKQRRAEMEAKMALLGDAFMSDDFDAASHDLGVGSREMMLKGMSDGATLVVAAAARVLTPAQRAAAAQRLRARAEKI